MTGMALLGHFGAIMWVIVDYAYVMLIK